MGCRQGPTLQGETGMCCMCLCGVAVVATVVAPVKCCQAAPSGSVPADDSPHQCHCASAVKLRLHRLHVQPQSQHGHRVVASQAHRTVYMCVCSSLAQVLLL